jgi:hypothetical protein
LKILGTATGELARAIPPSTFGDMTDAGTTTKGLFPVNA